MENIIEAPLDTDQLIIYEIATKGFTSPKGPESGTFASLAEKIPYLSELGVNAIWLSGHQLCDDQHFYNIWTEYACIRPDQLDPSLGTKAEFKNLVDTAHQQGLKIFLDVITHGVMKNSPLVKEHPEWFKGESWGMKDFDWYGNHQDLDEWWLKTWLTYVTDFGIDGFRLDVAHYRNDLWAELRKRSLKAGKRIVIIAENGPATNGVVDFLQHGENVSHNYGLNLSSRILNDAGGYFKDRQSRANEDYQVKIFYQDGRVQSTTDNFWYQSTPVPELIWQGTETRQIKPETYDVVYREQLGKIRIENILAESEIKNIQIKDRQGQLWNSNFDLVENIEVDFSITVKQEGRTLLLEFPLRLQDYQRMSVQLSCHDGGWDGYKLENPYAAQGSRYLLGYTTLLVPAIPIFMSGEEFAASYRPLPNLAPRLFEKKDFGTGSWLYGSWLDWEQLKQPEKQTTLADTKKIIQIRKEHSDLIKARRMGATDTDYGKVAYLSQKNLPQPYFYQNREQTIIVCANSDVSESAFLKLQLSNILATEKNWQASVLFGVPAQAENATGTPLELENITWEILKDKTAAGGLLVLKFIELV
ncbi:alpha-amylase family glycosyl hydrolase [Enterococcus sp. LJL90]